MFRWLLLFSSVSAQCQDLVSFCEQLKPICIGSIIADQLQQIQTLTEQIDNSTSIPALEQALPQVGSSAQSSEDNAVVNQTIETSLPLIKESLPLIRESLPLLRESLPLLRQFLDPKYFAGDVSACQKKITCKTVSAEEATEDLVKFYM